MKVIITLGPTREPIDSVRFITNASSGKMGRAIAEEAILRGYDVTIISGPVHISLPKGARITRVNTAREMIGSSLAELEAGCDIFISTAAIADYAPKYSKGKIKSGKDKLSLELLPNPKLTKKVKERYPQTFVVAFKAECCIESDELTRRAWEKLSSEGLDMIVANDVAKTGFGKDTSEVRIIDNKKDIRYIPQNSKDNISRILWNIIDSKVRGV